MHTHLLFKPWLCNCVVKKLAIVHIAKAKLTSTPLSTLPLTTPLCRFSEAPPAAQSFLPFDFPVYQ